MLHLRVQLFPPGHLLNCAVLPEEQAPAPLGQGTIPPHRARSPQPASKPLSFRLWFSHPDDHLMQHQPPSKGRIHALASGGTGCLQEQPPRKQGVAVGGLSLSCMAPLCPGGGDCSTSVLCSEFFFFFPCNSGFSLPQLSDPGKLPLVVPNAAPLGLLVLSVKPWQRRSPSGLQKPCQIWGLPGRWALLRAVTPLTAPDSSQTCFPGLTGV